MNEVLPAQQIPISLKSYPSFEPPIAFVPIKSNDTASFIRKLKISPIYVPRTTQSCKILNYMRTSFREMSKQHLLSMSISQTWLIEIARMS